MKMKWMLILALAVALGGCAWAAAAWTVGALSYGGSQIDANGGYRDYEAPVDTVLPIVLDELKKRGIEKTEEDIEYDKKGYGTLKEGDGHLKIGEHPKYKQFTRVYVKIGTFDTDKKAASIKEFLDAISDRLDQ